MSSKDTDGGSIWPIQELGHIGLNIRDYFAGQAMQALLTADSIGERNYIETSDNLSIAPNAYVIADAMLKEHNK